MVQADRKIDRLNHCPEIDSNPSLDEATTRLHVPSMFDLPTQLISYRCAMAAVDRTRNIARAYRIEASRDLYGHTIVNLRWGRIGQRGAGMTVSFADERAARRFIQRALDKRASAPQRIGVAYCLASDLE